MPEYTTGEITKRCGRSARTVQYYDTRNILIPSELSEGGRRLYTEQDVSKLESGLKLVSAFFERPVFMRDFSIS